MDVAKLEELADTQKAALRAYFVTPSYKAVARELNISIEAVKDRLERARRKLGVTDTHSAAYALAVTEGRATPPDGGWPPSGGLTARTNLGSNLSQPNTKAPIAAMVRDHSSAPPLPIFGDTPQRGKSDDNDLLKERFSTVSSQVVKAAQAIALIIVLAASAMAAINSLQPGFFRFLDNLHS